MSLFVSSLLVTLGYWLTTRLEMITWTSGCVSRPILVGPIVGLLLGDLKTGIILGGELEAIFMGVNGIGGQKPADQNVGTCLTVAYVILTGTDHEAALALAVPIATIIRNLQSVTKPLKTFLLPLILDTAHKGDAKKVEFLHFLGFLGLYNIDNYIAMFFLTYFGVSSLDKIMSVMPAFVMTGFTAAGNVLVAVGLGLTLSMIWNKELGWFYFIGFILVKSLGLSQIHVALVGACLSIMYYFLSLEIKSNKGGVVADEEDIFA